MKKIIGLLTSAATTLSHTAVVSAENNEYIANFTSKNAYGAGRLAKEYYYTPGIKTILGQTAVILRVRAE